MTKEERDKVIKVMKRLHDNDFLFKSTEEDIKYATELVIQTLEQESCEDAVSREFMYELGAKCIAARNENGVLVAIASIENLPSVTPQPKMGHWIENLCDSCTNNTCEFQSGIQRSKCDFYIAPMPHLEPGYRKRGINMIKEDRDNLLKYLAEKTNNDITDCRIKITKEKGKIEGLRMAAAQIANYVRGLAESEEYDENTN